MDNFSLIDCKWFNPPSMYSQTGSTEFTDYTFYPDSKSDFWKRTYYDPVLIHDNGHFLYKSFASIENFQIESHCFIFDKNQFDQGGLMIRLDTDNWIKFGIEVVDKKPKLSVVVTRDGYSDWSTQDWIDNEFQIRLYKYGSSIISEAYNKQKDSWDFVRISHLDFNKYKTYSIGIFACCPTESGAKIKFHNVNLKQCLGYDHKA